jgi:surfeit locus 1 family protein
MSASVPSKGEIRDTGNIEATVVAPARLWRGALVLLATVLSVTLTARLGFWQLSRAAQKETLQAAQDARSTMPVIDAIGLARTAEEAAAQHHRLVHLRGHWRPERTVFLDNRQMNGRPGFFVVTPLQLLGAADAVLVQRGWAPRDMRERTLLPKVPSSTDVVEVSGVIAPPPSRLFDLGASEAGPIRQNLDVAEFARESGLSLRPLSIVQGDSPSTAGDGLLRQWPRPAVDIHKHYGYAFQWFALAALMAGLYVWFQLLRPRLRRNT